MNNSWFKPSDLYWALAWFVAKLYFTMAPIPVLMRGAKLKGLFHALTSKKRELAKKNLISMWGDSWAEKQINAVVRRHFEYLETVKLIKHLPQSKGFANPACWPAEGLQYLEESLAQGKGTILVSAHFGYGRLIEDLLALRGYRLRVVHPGSNKMSKLEKRRKKQIKGYTAFAQFMSRRLQPRRGLAQREELYAEFNARPLVTALKQNEVLFIVADGLYAMKFVELDFLGRPMPFPTGFISIALATGATVLPIFAVDSSEGFGIKVIIEQPLLPDKKNAPARSLTGDSVEKFARLVESYVTRYPHLYGMVTDERGFEGKLARSRRGVAERY